MAVGTKVSDAKKQEILAAVGGYLEGTKDGKKVVTNDASLGGLAQGKKHIEGGIKGINKSTQQYVEIEAGEPVINERSANMPATHNFNGKTLTNKQILNEINTAAGGAEIKANGGEIGVAKPIVYTGGQVVITAKALDDKTLKEFDGKQMTNQEILSHINEQGGGLSFAQGGNMPSTLNCSGKMYNFGGEMQDDYSIAKSCGCKHQKALQDREDFKAEKGSSILPSPKENLIGLLTSKESIEASNPFAFKKKREVAKNHPEVFLLKDGGEIRNNNFQQGFAELIKNEGYIVSYYDSNINDVSPKIAEQIVISKFDPYYESYTIKLPSKKEITFDWVMNKIVGDKTFVDLSKYLEKIVRNKGLNVYATSYGIGAYVLFGRSNQNENEISNILDNYNIDYTNEYSDANWVYRWKISKSKQNIEKLNKIIAQNNSQNQFAEKGLQIEYNPLIMPENEINNIVDFRNALKKSQLKYSDNFSYKNGSHYLTIEGFSFRVSDHPKPKGTSELYEEGENDFRSYQELYNELEKRFDMSDKTDVEKMYKKNAQKDIIEDYSLGELSYKTPDNRLYGNVENAVNSMWYRRYDYDKYTKNQFAEKGIQVNNKKTNPFDPVNSNYYQKQNGLLAEEENLKSGGTISLGKYKFKGYNIPATAPENDTQKKVVLVNDGENIKIVKFGLRGMQDFTQHKDEQRRKNYLTRSAGIVDGRERLTKDNPLSANYWSRRILWDSGEDILKPIYVDENLMLEYGATIEKKNLLAPNGKPSNLNETQWHLVRTTAFKNWFGDWENDPENASKVVDNNGEPLVVYHGTKDKRFSIFDENKFGERSKSPNSKAFFFTPSKWYASAYSESGNNEQIKTFKEMFGYLPKAIEPRPYADEIACFLNIKNPNYTFNSLLETIVYTKINGFDGIIVNNKNENTIFEIAAFHPNQIKLATGENITFDGNNPSILMSNGGGIDEYANNNPNENFIKWFVKWFQAGVNEVMNITISIPILDYDFGIDAKQNEILILDLFEKINQNIDAKPYLKIICEKADEFGVYLLCEPMPRYKYFLNNIEKRKKISVQYLINYYNKFGFEKIEGKQFMCRKPNNKKIFTPNKTY